MSRKDDSLAQTHDIHRACMVACVGRSGEYASLLDHVAPVRDADRSAYIDDLTVDIGIDTGNNF